MACDLSPGRQAESSSRHLGSHDIALSVVCGTPVVADPVQVRTWNLSSMWRLPTTHGDVWLKAVPGFFAHEGAMIEALQAFAVPRLIARTDGVCLIEDIPGDDLYDADIPQAKAMIDLLIDMQRSVRRDDLPAGVPDRSVDALAPAAEHTLRESAHELDSGERATLARLIHRRDAIARDLAECGIPRYPRARRFPPWQRSWRR